MGKVRVTVEHLDGEYKEPLIYELNDLWMGQKRCSDGKPLTLLMGTSEDSISSEQLAAMHLRSSDETIAGIKEAFRDHPVKMKDVDIQKTD